MIICMKQYISAGIELIRLLIDSCHHHQRVCIAHPFPVYGISNGCRSLVILSSNKTFYLIQFKLVFIFIHSITS